MSGENIIKSTVNGTITGSLMETVLKGLSEYELAKKHGFEGEEIDWLNTRNIHFEIKSDKNLEDGSGEYKIRFYSGGVGDQITEVTTPDLLPIANVAERAIHLILPNKDLKEGVVLYMNDIPVSENDATGIKTYTDNAINTEKSRAEDVESSLSNTKVDKATTVNNYALGENIVISMGDIPVSSENTTTAKEYVDAEVKSAKDYTDKSINNLIGENAVEKLNTLEELGKALGDDENFAVTVSEEIGKNKTAIENEVKRATEKEESIDDQISGLSTGKVDKTTTVNNKELGENITLLLSDIPADEDNNSKEYIDNKVKALEDSISENSVAINGLNNKKASILSLDQEILRAETKEGELNTAIKANSASITTLNSNVADLQTFKVDKVDGYSLVEDAEIERLASVDNYDDTNISNKITALEQNVIRKTDIVQNATTDNADMVISAAVAKNLQDQITEQNVKSWAKAYLSTEYTLTTTDTKLDLTEETCIGNKLQIVDGSIKALEDCLVLMTANTYLTTGYTVGDLVVFSVLLNNETNICLSSEKVGYAVPYKHLNIAYITKLSAGDTLSLYARNNTTASGKLGAKANLTYLSVAEI